VYRYLILLTLLLVTPAYAGHIASPPPTIEDRDTLIYLRKVHNALENFDIVTTEPNGNRRGRIGDVIIFNDSGTYRWRLNTDTGIDGGTTWVSIS